MNSRIGIRNQRNLRRIALAVGVVAVALLAIPHLVFGSQNATVAPPAVNTGQAHRLVSVTTGGGPATLYTAPATNGYVCVTISVPDGAAASPGNSQFGNGGGECHQGDALAQRLSGVQLTTSMNWVPVTGGTVALVVEGRAGSAIQRVALQLPDGTVVPAALSSTFAGYYVSRITAPAIGELPGDVAVVGYDAGGRPLTRVSLQDVLAAATP